MTPLPLYTHQYFDIKPGHSRRQEDSIRWREGLPAEWAGQVIAPLYFDHYLDYEIVAARILGRDEDDQACYVAHSFVLETPASAATARATYAESLRAWRLRDGRWLIHRIVIGGGLRDQDRGFFTLGNAMPG